MPASQRHLSRTSTVHAQGSVRDLTPKSQSATGRRHCFQRLEDNLATSGARDHLTSRCLERRCSAKGRRRQRASRRDRIRPISPVLDVGLPDGFSGSGRGHTVRRRRAPARTRASARRESIGRRFRSCARANRFSTSLEFAAVHTADPRARVLSRSAPVLLFSLPRKIIWDRASLPGVSAVSWVVRRQGGTRSGFAAVHAGHQRGPVFSSNEGVRALDRTPSVS